MKQPQTSNPSLLKQKNLVTMRAMRVLFFIVVATFFGGVHSARALTVSPAKIEITGDPGKTIQGEIELYNEQEGSRTFYSSFENFEPSGDSGAPHFTGGNTDLATWLNTPTTVTLSSGAREKIPFSITIPQDAQPGGHFAAVFWGTQAPGEQGGGEVSIGGKIGILILLRVSGDIPEGGGLLDFTAQKKQLFFSTLPVSFTFRLNNTGGDRVVPLGTVTIKNTFQLLSTTLPANKNEGSVLPASARKFEVTWTDTATAKEATTTGFFAMAGQELRDFHFGWYRAQLHLVWGVTNQTADASYSFFIIPWQLLSIVFSGMVIVGLLGIIGVRRYNRWIIKKATQS